MLYEAYNIDSLLTSIVEVTDIRTYFSKKDKLRNIHTILSGDGVAWREARNISRNRQLLITICKSYQQTTKIAACLGRVMTHKEHEVDVNSLASSVAC